MNNIQFLVFEEKKTIFLCDMTVSEPGTFVSPHNAQKQTSEVHCIHTLETQFY